MSYQHKPNSGSLFLNRERDKETSPHAKGSALIDGVEYWVNAWTNTKTDGEKWQGLKFTRKDSQKMPRSQSMPEAKQENAYAKDFDDDIPF